MKKVFVVAISLILAVALGLGVLMVLGITGVGSFGNWFGSQGPMELVNRQEFDADDFSALAMHYTSDDIELVPGDGGKLVLEEYMTKRDDSLLAHISQEGGTLSIRGGERNFGIGLWGFSSRIVLYIPQGWAGDVRVENSSGRMAAEHSFTFGTLSMKNTSGGIRLGSITARGDITLENSSGGIEAGSLDAGGTISLSATSGSIRAGAVQAQEVHASNTSGSLRFDEASAALVTAQNSSGGISFGRLDGRFELGNTSGGIRVEGGAAHGTAQASSGSVSVELDEATGDVSLASTSGGCSLELPRGTSFELYCSTTSGSIHTPGADGAQRYVQNDNTVEAAYGTSPTLRAELRASSGSVRLELD